MKNTLKVAIIVLILVVISVILFITGKRHDILIENNSSTGIKYSINGEPYKTLDIGKKAEGITKGLGNIGRASCREKMASAVERSVVGVGIKKFIKTNDNKVIEKDLPSDDINIFIKEIINNTENWYKENNEN